MTQIIWFISEVGYDSHQAVQGDVDDAIENLLRQAPHQPGGSMHAKKRKVIYLLVKLVKFISSITCTFLIHIKLK